MRAHHPKPLLLQNVDHRCQQPVIPSECRTSDPGQKPHSFEIEAEIHQGWPADGADKHKVATVMRAQGGQDLPSCAHTDQRVRIGRQ